MQFLADKVRVNGPLADGGYSVTFSVGEYESSKVAQLLTIPQDVIKKVTVEVDG